MLAIDESRGDRVPEGFLSVGRRRVRVDGNARSSENVPVEQSIFSVCR